MPKRTDIKKILVIGSGPIIIGQACEFDYSGTQACRALRKEGYEVVLVNSNPATIMTDPEIADRTYVEPITPEVVGKIIEAERPDAILPTLGGQTGLNTAMEVAESGVLEKFGVEMLGADRDVIHRAENREAFKTTMQQAGLGLPRSAVAHNMEEARRMADEIGFPVIIRPAFTLGGTGGGTAFNREEFERIAEGGIKASRVSEILIEESLLGWKEFELEVMRDKLDNVVIVCSIENLDPMGVHTGDSITVAPVQTLTDREYQEMRDAAIRIIRAIGVETGGCNIQFAQCPRTGRLVVIEMNPRVSRSSALASKATGFPIAKIAALVAVGYTLDEIPNDITRQTPACFEPTIDYCVVKIPRFNFEKFPGCDPVLTISMKSVGEVMAIGRTFKEAMQKGLRSIERGRMGFGVDGVEPPGGALSDAELVEKLAIPNPERIVHLRTAIERGMTIEKIHEITSIDPWFLDNFFQLFEFDSTLHGEKLDTIPPDTLRTAKALGYADRQLAFLLDADERAVRRRRKALGIRPTFKLVDTCAAEFEAYTPYFYSCYEDEDEARPSGNPSVIILGGGPNRIGQGIEFDYCCVHASMAIRESGMESVMVNCNPETVSTDYDTSDRLYFEPLTVEDVTAIVDTEKPVGVIVQFGGQTPLNISAAIEAEGAKILGTGVADIRRAEDRKEFALMLTKLKLKQPPNATGVALDEVIGLAAKIGYPVLMRPSFVLGGAKMEIVYDEPGLKTYWRQLLEYCKVADVQITPERPILIDKFLENAVEIDVDCVSDRRDVYIAGIMEHIEEAGIHSGDSACTLPPVSLTEDVLEKIRTATEKMARELNVCGLMNVQYAVKDNEIFVIEVNPRASRTVPFVSKVTGVPIAKIATKVMLGKTLAELGIGKNPEFSHIGVKEAVLPFSRFPGVDAQLGPEMKSTGEVMGIDATFGMAYAKAQLAAGQNIPTAGTVCISVRSQDRRAILPTARILHLMGFGIVATRGTADFLNRNDVPAKRINKVAEGRPHIADAVKNGEIDLIINTPSSKQAHEDEILIRSSCVALNIPLVTTATGAAAVANGIQALRNGKLAVKPLQDHYRDSGLGR